MTLHHGDCLDVMAAMEPESVDAIVTDPPYGLEFMGVAWDTMRLDGTPRPRNEWGDFGSREHARGQHDLHRVTRNKGVALYDFSRAWAEAAYRVAKPSAYLLAFGGTRTFHRLACALEDAGWIIRDTLVWGYASGFPKSKASLKPAWEPIVMARKPGPLRDLAIDRCRIPVDPSDPVNGAVWTSRPSTVRPGTQGFVTTMEDGQRNEATAGELGRWPANIVLTDPIFDGGWEGVVGGGRASDSPSDITTPNRSTTHSNLYGGGAGLPNNPTVFGYGDSGTYSRFFLIPKADRADREPVLGGQVAKGPQYKKGGVGGTGGKRNVQEAINAPWRENHHPTVKPTDLMRHLVRLVTPPGGTVLDPFLGSGTTAIAAEMEGFAWIGIEREEEYVRIAEARLNGTQRGLGLEAV